MKRFAGAADRNKGPILEVLKTVLPTRGVVLEVASGTGQHAAFFAEHLPHLDFIPSDADPEALASIEQWRKDTNLPNLHQQRLLDVLNPDWPVTEVDAVLCSNMIHIAPWACAVALINGAARVVSDGGLLILYGPFSENGHFAAPSNAEFDQSLRERNPQWGVRDLRVVESTAAAAGFCLQGVVQMPVNNLTLIFQKVQQ
ncbi:MAG: DUF938 domain-containing protein [Myxococcales bacterium]|nr:DUF938 domain-containing protein [Myxococcales bacterium]